MFKYPIQCQPLIFIPHTFSTYFIGKLGFYARPIKKPDNSTDIMFWETGIPGKAGTDWDGGVFKVTMEFPEEYPSKVSEMACT